MPTKDKLTEEINKIAEEILKDEGSLELLFSDLQSLPTKTKVFALKYGLKVQQLEGLKFAFLRFYTLAEEEFLTENAKTLHKELYTMYDSINKFTKEDGEIPEQLKNFINGN